MPEFAHASMEARPSRIRHNYWGAGGGNAGTKLSRPAHGVDRPTPDRVV